MENNQTFILVYVHCCDYANVGAANMEVGAGAPVKVHASSVKLLSRSAVECPAYMVALFSNYSAYFLICCYSWASTDAYFALNIAFLNTDCSL